MAYNAGEAVEIIKAIGGASVIPSLAAILVQWLKNKSARRVSLQREGKILAHLEGYSVKEVESMLKKTDEIVVIQTYM